MNPTRPRPLLPRQALFVILPLAGMWAGLAAPPPPPEPEVPPRLVTAVEYHGWKDALLLSNGKVEAVVVPSIGRVMQFRFAGEEDGPFWENRSLDGKAGDPEAKEWVNFGGDKTWPAPQSDWPKKTPRAWPPPPAYDALPCKASVDDHVVTLVSEVDPNYGIRIIRRIELEFERPVMSILTTYEKVSGRPIEVSVWTITQLKDPVLVHAELPLRSVFRDGYVRLSEEIPANLRLAGGGLSLTRDPKQAHKIGTDAGTLIWVGSNAVVRVASPRQNLRRYPDQQSSTEIYTNPDPAAYIELETLGPLEILKPGLTCSHLSFYTLLPRTERDPALEVKRVLAR